MNLPIDSDSLLADLDESLPQGVANSTQVADPLDQLDPLAELLLESMSDAQEREAYKADLKARKRGFINMSKEEVDFCNSRMQTFEQARMWKPVENLAVFARFVCTNCNSEKLVFSRWMMAMKSRTNPTTRKWDTVLKPNQHVLTRTAVDRRLVPLCPSCAVAEGLDTHTMIDLQEALK